MRPQTAWGMDWMCVMWGVLNCCVDLQESASELKRENEFSGTHLLHLLVNGMLRSVETANTRLVEPPCTIVGATTDRREEPRRREATMVLEPLQEEALTTGTRGDDGAGAPAGRGTDGFGICEWEVVVQGDEGPFCGVAQVVDCLGVTAGHQEREEEEVEQEVEGDGEKTLKERCACPWMG